MGLPLKNVGPSLTFGQRRPILTEDGNVVFSPDAKNQIFYVENDERALTTQNFSNPDEVFMNFINNV